MESLEYIDNYFRGERSEDERRQFEKRILEDQSFAEEVAFYLSAAQAARDLEWEAKKDRFREIYELSKPQPSDQKVKKLWPWAAAAAVLAGALIGIFMFMMPPSPRQLAHRYVDKEFSVMGIKMGLADDLETAKNLYNRSKYAAALEYFEKIIRQNDTNFLATKYAGICCLKLRKYDKALSYFEKFSKAKPFARPDVLYQALTLLERNKSGDKDKAKTLLETIVQEDLEGKEFAQDVLDKWR